MGSIKNKDFQGETRRNLKGKERSCTSYKEDRKFYRTYVNFILNITGTEDYESRYSQDSTKTNLPQKGKISSIKRRKNVWNVKKF